MEIDVAVLTALAVTVCWVIPALLHALVRTRPVSFSFGLVADVQAGDKPDGKHDGRTQFYRASFAKLGQAAAEWNARCGGKLWHFTSAIGGGGAANVKCVLSLGDAVDGNMDEATTAAELAAVVAHYRSLPCPTHHVLGNHCMKRIPRQRCLAMLGHSGLLGYRTVELSEGWRLLLLDTTDLSLHGGWAAGSPQDVEARAFFEEHDGLTRVKPYNGGVGRVQLEWLRRELRRAEADAVRVIAASHHPLPAGACAETHRAWNGDVVADALTDSPAFALALSGHYHPGGFVRYRGRPFVTLEALLESPPHQNAFALVRVTPEAAPRPGFRFTGARIDIDGCGTGVRSRAFVV